MPDDTQENLDLREAAAYAIWRGAGVTRAAAEQLVAGLDEAARQRAVNIYEKCREDLQSLLPKVA